MAKEYKCNKIRYESKELAIEALRKFKSLKRYIIGVNTADAFI